MLFRCLIQIWSKAKDLGCDSILWSTSPTDKDLLLSGFQFQHSPIISMFPLISMLPPLCAKLCAAATTCRMSKYGAGRMYWTEILLRGSLKSLGKTFDTQSDFNMSSSWKDYPSTGLVICVISIFTLLNLRKTKRQCLEEAMEWDELNETGDIPDPDEAMEFSMIKNPSNGYLPWPALFLFYRYIHPNQTIP